MKTNKLFLIIVSTLIALTMVMAPAQQSAGIAITGLQNSASNSSVDYSTQPVNTLSDGSSTVTRVTVSDLFDFPVIQQPSGNAGYVSSKSSTLTQFGMATSYGSIGILAHNNLAGKYFKSLSGKTITVTFSDGSTKNYTVSTVKQFQALSPSDPYSNFVDLNDSSVTLSSTDLFLNTFGIGGALVFQTCIAKNGNSSWGRLFIIAYAS
jgi:hypothetical protein